MELEQDAPKFDLKIMRQILSLVSMARVFPAALAVLGFAVLEVLLESQGE